MMTKRDHVQSHYQAALSTVQGLIFIRESADKFVKAFDAFTQQMSWAAADQVQHRLGDLFERISPIHTYAQRNDHKAGNRAKRKKR